MDQVWHACFSDYEVDYTTVGGCRIHPSICSIISPKVGFKYHFYIEFRLGLFVTTSSRCIGVLAQRWGTMKSHSIYNTHSYYCTIMKLHLQSSS